MTSNLWWSEREIQYLSSALMVPDSQLTGEQHLKSLFFWPRFQACSRELCERFALYFPPQSPDQLIVLALSFKVD